VGGIGSIRGAFVAAVFVGLVDTLGRAFLPDLLHLVLSTTAASTLARALSSMLVYLLMAAVLALRPQGLFPVAGRWRPRPTPARRSSSSSSLGSWRCRSTPPRAAINSRSPCSPGSSFWRSRQRASI